METLVELLKLGGTAALVVGVLYLLYRQLLSLHVVPKLNQRQGFTLLMTVSVLVFIVAVIGLTQANLINLKALFSSNVATINGSSNTVEQNAGA